MKLSKNVEFSIKLGVVIVLIIFLISNFIEKLSGTSNFDDMLPFDQRIEMDFAYFTVQSNYITVIYILFSLIFEKIYNRKINYGIELAVTTYISLTMIIFWSTIITNTGGEDNAFVYTNFWDWTQTCIFHLIIPIIMIFTYFTSCGDNFYSIKNHSKLSVFLIAAYPFGYLMYQLIRMTIKSEVYGSTYIENNFWVVDAFGDGTGVMQSVWYHFNDGSFKNLTSINGVTSAQLYSYSIWASYYFLNIINFKYYIPVKIWDKDLNQFVYDHNHYYDISTKEIKSGIWDNGVVNFNNYSTHELISSFVLCVCVITFFSFAIQYYFLYKNNQQYFVHHKITGERFNSEELKINKWKKTHLITIWNSIYYSNIKILRHLRIRRLVWKDFINLSKFERKKIYIESIKYVEDSLEKHKLEVKMFKKKLKNETKFIKISFNEIPYIERYDFRKNCQKAHWLQINQLRGTIRNITHEDREKYYEFLSNKKIK